MITVHQPRIFSRNLVLFAGDSQVGTMTRTGIFRTQTEGTFDDYIDTATRIFVIWIANAIWLQDQAAAAAAG
jgi:hypothetical protein